MSFTVHEDEGTTPWARKTGAALAAQERDSHNLPQLVRPINILKSIILMALYMYMQSVLKPS